MKEEKLNSLKDKYNKINDEEIIELIGCGKEAFDKDVYAIILNEFKKKKLTGLNS